jgi:hypothetical protein
MKTWNKRDFSWSEDSTTVALAFIKGASGVFNKFSMAQFCVNNASLIPDALTKIANNILVEETRVKGIEAFVGLLRFTQGTTFNCFYMFFDPLTATQIRTDFNITIFFWNLMFNLGFFYTDVKRFIDFFYFKDGTPESQLVTWKTLAATAGDFSMRLFYSRYYPTRVENFFSFF